MIPKEAIEAFYSKAEVQQTGTILNMEAALTAAFAAMSKPVAWVSQNTLSILADGHEGAFKEAISNKPFSRFSVPLYAAPQPAAVKVNIETAVNDDALTKKIADFLLERDQQTSQDERDEGEREASAFFISQMVRRRILSALEGGGE